ncbi:MAG TPA: DUF2141 domain-containing protein [Bacteroidia bacterium]|nr:DUF2141 domain-containing protein [Bacteroidia bacterium]
MKFVVLFLMHLCVIGFGQTLKINITGIRNTEGSICLAFYNTQESFGKEQPLFVKTISKKGLTNGVLSYTYTGLKAGTYGIAMMDDENNNAKMDYGLILPKEGFGFSNYYHTGMSRPTFDKFSFTVSNADKTIEIKVKYM